MQLQSATAEPKRRSRREPPRPIAVPVNEACGMGGFGRTLCYELISQGKLKTVAIGRRRLVLVESLRALLQPDAAA
jgi:hypothetical protein